MFYKLNIKLDRIDKQLLYLYSNSDSLQTAIILIHELSFREKFRSIENQNVRQPKHENNNPTELKIIEIKQKQILRSEISKQCPDIKH